MTQSEFGETLGLKWSQIKDRELGTTEIKLYLAIKIENAHGINKEWLLYGTGQMLLKNGAKYSRSEAETGNFERTGELSAMQSDMITAITISDAAANFGELMGLCGVVLESRTIYAEALAQNIRAFHHGLTVEGGEGPAKKTIPEPLPGAAEGGGREKASG